MAPELNPANLPSINFEPLRYGLGAWTEHVFFAYDLVAQLKPRLLVELVIFASAIVAFYEAGSTTLAAVFGVLAVGSAVLVRVWPEPVA